jgi:hypothetical protein
MVSILPLCYCHWPWVTKFVTLCLFSVTTGFKPLTVALQGRWSIYHCATANGLPLPSKGVLLLRNQCSCKCARLHLELRILTKVCPGVDLMKLYGINLHNLLCKLDYFINGNYLSLVYEKEWVNRPHDKFNEIESWLNFHKTFFNVFLK